MKTIINAKNALITLFGLECLCSFITLLLSFIVINTTISGSCYFLYRLGYIIACIGLLYIPSEYITKTAQKVGLWILIIHKIINIILYNILPLINQGITFYSLLQNNFGEDAYIYIGLYSTIVSFITVIAFLMFIWGFQIKKSYRGWITFLYFVPGLVLISLSLIDVYLPQNLIEYKYQIKEITEIIVFSMMLWLIHKGYKIKNKIQ